MDALGDSEDLLKGLDFEALDFYDEKLLIEEPSSAVDDLSPR